MSDGIVATFPTTHDALRAGKAAAPACRTIPTPREISSECGFALFWPATDPAIVTNFFVERKLRREALYLRRKKQRGYSYERCD